MLRKSLSFAAAAIVAGSLASLPANAQELTIATSLPSFEFPFFVHMQKQLDAEAEALGGITLLSTDGQNSATKQTGDIEAAITRGVDGIIISPLDAVALAPVLQQAVDAGVPVITIDRRVEGVPGILAHVGADNVLGGEAQANQIMKMFPDGATIFNLQGQPGASPAIDRNAGVHNVLDALSDKYKFIFEQTAFFARDKGVTVTEAGLAGLDNPPDVIVAANDDMALGAAVAVKDAGLSIPILGFDALPEALGAIQSGDLAGTVEQSPGGQSRGAMQQMVAFLRDGTKPDAVTLLTPFILTKDNIDQAERLGELQ